ncbi:unannotated protein [freshwater metagenome]|uniref:Unannotated protein n=1 Tax=freshwater metagenome TaxID=449393 RepID=A0A6J7HIJ9_9ZZZZ|nr:molybdate ABC transporter substrate-binding protein [Actinomycetota bacterium]
MRRRATILALVAVGVALVLPGGAQATTVFAASSLRDAFPRIDRQATWSFGASNLLLAQIRAGAPADLFASASTAEPWALYRRGGCLRPVVFATNRLVLLVPRSNPAGIRTAFDLAHGSRKRVAVAAPGVPVGDYARRALARLGLAGVLQRNLVSSEINVAGVVSKVALGSADAGFAYKTDARIAARRVRAIALPGRAQPPIRYAACVVRRRGADRAGALATLARIRSASGRRTLRGAGFGVPGA